MLGFAAIVLAILFVGFGLTSMIASKLEPGWFDASAPLEIFSASALLGWSVWLAASWLLAVTGFLTQGALQSVSALFVAGALLVLWRHLPSWRQHELPKPVALQIAAMLPIIPWLGFALWRGSVLPPLSHDALSYHFPKALMIARAHAFRYFEAPDVRISHLPANYELMVADLLLLAGNDRLTEWIGTVTFCLFLAAAGAVAQRWWQLSTTAIPVILVVASAPVVLLHSVADKNDLMIGTLAVYALVWGARWATAGGNFSLVLLIAALTAGGGTKPQQAAILLGLLPFLLVRAFRDVRRDRGVWVRYALVAVAAVAWFGLSGGAAYVANALHESSPLSMEMGATAVDETNAVFQWGDWQNLWQFPILLFLVGLSPEDTAVWVPWRGEYWFWPEFELYFSHYGALLSLLMLAVPFAVWASRRDAGRRERIVFSVAALIALALTLPVQFRPVGAFASFPRYIVYVLPVIACWTVAPLYVRALRRPAMAGAVLVLAAGAFVSNAVRVAIRDQFAPLPYVLWTVQNPGNREIFYSPNRAASVVDRVARPTDRIAIDAAFDSWIYPAYGRGLTREVVFLPQAGTDRPVQIPSDIQWVLVDRSWTALWGHPMLTDMGRFWKYRERGRPRDKDLVLYRQLLGDARFALVFRDPGQNQAVFWRIVGGRAVPYSHRVRFQAPPSEDRERSHR